ncbi:MAG: dTDP-4-dehydrorhamnose reductase [Reyranellaceae bacterium]
MNVLVCGGSGQVGLELLRQQWRSDVRLVAPARRELDLGDDASISEVFRNRSFAAVVNAAAYTAVDAAQQEVSQAWRINAVAPALLAYETGRLGIPLIHVSTDYVFDGTSDRPYVPADPVAPLNVYGASKEGGEQGVRTGNQRHVIIRTAWVVSPHRKNFVKTMLHLANERDLVRVVDDQAGCPTSASDLAAAVRAVVMRQLAGNGACGTYHFVNRGITTWFRFAEAIMRGASRRGHRAVPVEPVATAAYPTAARRPMNSALSTETLARDYQVAPRPWEQAIDEVLDRLISPMARAET